VASNPVGSYPDVIGDPTAVLEGDTVASFNVLGAKVASEVVGAGVVGGASVGKGVVMMHVPVSASHSPEAQVPRTWGDT
jgi:hypothetical protein